MQLKAYLLPFKLCVLLAILLSACGKKDNASSQEIQIEYFNTAQGPRNRQGANPAPEVVPLPDATFELTGSPEEQGYRIIRESERRDEGYGDFQADMTMILYNQAGDEARRVMRTQVLEVPEDGDKALIIFDHPGDVRGTALLTHSRKDRPDDQWIYLPDLKRVKRIASTNKTGPFMGSEFSYEDLSDHIMEKYTYGRLDDETYLNMDCFVVEEFPTDDKSGYTRQVVWLDKAELRVHQVAYYDRKGSHLKTLTFTEYEKYLDQFWRPGASLMINHQTGKSTRLLFTNYRFQTGLTDRDFDVNSLARAR